MELETEFERAKNEVLRKIGRNMLLFQQVEHMLKFLVINGKISGYVSEISADLEQRAAGFRKQTMGPLTKILLEDFYSGCEEATEGPTELKETHISIFLRMKGDAGYYERRKQSLTSIVSARNELIHHLLPKFDLSSIESCLQTERYLDQQREQILPEIKKLKGMINLLLETKKGFAEFLRSQEGKELFVLPLLRQSRLVELLAKIARRTARSDGWSLLRTARHLIREQVPKEMSTLSEVWGYKTLKSFVLATELFDLKEEPTEKGGVRVLYRPKVNWEQIMGGETLHENSITQSSKCSFLIFEERRTLTRFCREVQKEVLRTAKAQK